MDPINQLLINANNSGCHKDVYLLAAIAVQLKRLADRPEPVNCITEVRFTDLEEHLIRRALKRINTII